MLSQVYNCHDSTLSHSDAREADGNIDIRECLIQLSDTKKVRGRVDSFFDLYAYSIRSGRYGLAARLGQALSNANGVEPTFYRLGQFIADHHSSASTLDQKFDLLRDFFSEESSRGNLDFEFGGSGLILGYVHSTYNTCIHSVVSDEQSVCLEHYLSYRQSMLQRHISMQDGRPAVLLTLVLDKYFLKTFRDREAVEGKFEEYPIEISERQISESIVYYSEKRFRNNADRFMFVVAMRVKIEEQREISEAEKRTLGFLYEEYFRRSQQLAVAEKCSSEAQAAYMCFISGEDFNVFEVFGEIVVGWRSFRRDDDTSANGLAD